MDSSKGDHVHIDFQPAFDSKNAKSLIRMKIAANIIPLVEITMRTTRITVKAKVGEINTILFKGVYLAQKCARYIMIITNL